MFPRISCMLLKSVLLLLLTVQEQVKRRTSLIHQLSSHSRPLGQKNMLNVARTVQDAKVMHSNLFQILISIDYMTARMLPNPRQLESEAENVLV